MNTVTQALALFKKGQQQEAEHQIQAILQRTPNDLQALQALGMMAAQTGRLDEAERLWRRCVELAPNQPANHINLANLLMGLGRINEAEGFYRRAIALVPQMPVAHYNYGRCLSALGRLDEAILAYRKALALQPAFFEAGVNLGLVLCEKEAYQEAEEVYRNLLNHHPETPELRVYLGDMMRLRGQPDKARLEYEAVLHKYPQHPRARLSLGLLWIDEHGLAKAAELIEPLIKETRLPKGDVLVALALLRARQGDQKTAIDLLSEAIRAGANRPQHYLTQAIWLAEIRNRDQALAVLEQSLALFGDKPPEILGQLIVNQRHLCNWQHWDERIKTLVERIKNTDRAIISPFVALSIPGLNSADLLKVARAFAKRFQPWVKQSAKLPQRVIKDISVSRIRIGYLSCDFHEHATAYLTAGVFERHDRKRFEIFAYSWGPNDDSAMRRRLLSAFDRFVEIGSLSHFDAASRIRADGIDILVDLKGYTRNARTEILALRPCPIQVNWLGYPGSMGASFIDYIIVDSITVPEDHASYYDERLAYMPHAYAPVDDVPVKLMTPTRADAGLPEEGFVFCSFNNPYKITPDIFDRWCNLLKDIEGSVLWLFAERESVKHNLCHEARLRGIAPERLIFASKVSHEKHLARLTLADLCLDTLPYNAHTTASDALRAGIPILTCLGETFPGRVAASLLTAAGMSELIVQDLDAYEAQARFLATHPDELIQLRERLRAGQHRSAYFDTERFTRNLEFLYQRMWEIYQCGHPPRLIAPK
ncbi:tetratricopeptide repeat protein [Caldichromatium japonicum]|uniref:protein O-GlcNAc transferase n=1 Tax=Caldichromatium japonicum TaxID=2699430 RepID=A0A6G7VEV8_9GAMM|nr:tetratricopeptide repeat protein [Caldichromatium japonicum]QIK38613.1 tetratricopeptide repeat protein [Caldichromatium japonicum]